MLELGKQAKRAHEEIQQMATQFDGCFYVGAGFSSTQATDQLWFAEANDELLRTLQRTLEPNDCLLIKGSNRVFWAKGFVPQLAQTLK